MMRQVYKFLIWVEKYRWWILWIAFGLGLGGGGYVYNQIYGVPLFPSLIYSVQLFVADVKTFSDLSLLSSLKEVPDNWKWIYVPATFAQIFLFFGLVLLFFKSGIATLHHRSSIDKGEHTLVIGLGRNSRFFIDSELNSQNQSNIVVVEKSRENPYIKRYQDQAVSVIVEDVNNYLDKLNLNEAKEIFISTGNDQENILIALKILERLKSNMNKKLIIHIEDRTLRSLYVDRGLLPSNVVTIEQFSFYQQAARELFLQHSIEGEGYEVIESNKPFGVAVVGDTPLAVEILFEAIKVAQLPNENTLHLYFIDRDPVQFEEHIRYHIPDYDQLPNTVIEFIGLDAKKIDFYQHPALWKNSTLKHVICHEESVDNVRIATKLKNFTYVNLPMEFTIPKIHIGVYHHTQIADEVRKFSHDKSNAIYPFAIAKEICHRDHLLDEKLPKLAKMIHRSYQLYGYNPSNLMVKDTVLNRTWEDKVMINDQKSSFAQILHIDMKLKALGLKRHQSSQAVESLAEANRKVLEKVLAQSFDELHLDQAKIDTLFEELKAFEKNRRYGVPFFRIVIRRYLKSCYEPNTIAGWQPSPVWAIGMTAKPKSITVTNASFAKSTISSNRLTRLPKMNRSQLSKICERYFISLPIWLR